MKYILLLIKFLKFRIFIHKSRKISNFFNEILKKKISVFDLGAGHRYLPTLLKFDGISKIYMIDPNKNLDLAYNNFLKYFKKKGDVKKIQVGIGSKNKKLRYYPARISTGSSFKKINNSDREKNFDYFGNIKSYYLNVYTLSNLIKKFKLKNPDIMKIDVEGMEFELLQSILKKYKPFIIEVELNLDKGIFKESFTKSHNLLKKNKYFLNTIYPAFKHKIKKNVTNDGFEIGSYNYPIWRSEIYQVDGYYHLKKRVYSDKELIMLIGYGFISEANENFLVNQNKFSLDKRKKFQSLFNFLKC